MGPKKIWKNKAKTNKALRHAKRKHDGNHRDGRTSARLAIEDMTSVRTIRETSPSSTVNYKAPKSGQAPNGTPCQDGSPWHDSPSSHLYPPTPLNFRQSLKTDNDHLLQKSPPLTEYAGNRTGLLAPMMAPGQDQQQRNQQPPHSRPHTQQTPGQQKPSSSVNGLPVNGEQQQRDENARERDTERDSQARRSNGPSIGTGAMPSHIQVAKPYVFQQAIEGCLKDVGVTQAREDNIRLAGVQWIDNVRRALKLPVRTFDTAVVYYHKFRLVHSDGEYSFVDAAAAALFAACKIEDTLKKSRDILCAAHNLKVARNEQLSPDDASFEHHSRSIIGLERLMLEASSFDFRNRHPQTLMIKLAKHYNLGSPRTSPIVKTAYSICLDLYRTFAPLKQSTATLAFCCLELAIRLHNEQSKDGGTLAIIHGDEYSRWGISRGEVMETLLDLLELYTHYRSSTTVGPEFPLDTFLEVRIPLNEELNSANLPRFTEYIDTGRSGADPAGYAATVNGVSAAVTETTANGTTAGKTDKSPTSPSSANTASGKANGIRQKAGERGREGTVRFMINPDRERQERLVVAEYHPQPQPPPPQSPSLPSGPAASTASVPTQPQEHRQGQPPSYSHGGSHPQAHRGSGSGRGGYSGRGGHGHGYSRGQGPRHNSSGRGDGAGLGEGPNADGRPPRRDPKH